MQIVLIVLSILNIASIIYFWYRANKLYKDREDDINKRFVGTILLNDDESLYLELNDQNSMNKIFNSDYVIFDVQKKTNTLN